MGLSRKDLGADEHIVVSVRTSPMPLLMPILLVLVAVVTAFVLLTRVHVASSSIRLVGGSIIMGIPVLFFVVRLAAWRRRTVVLTTDRVVVVDGVLSRRTDQVLLDRIIDVQIVRRLRDRIVGRGDLILEVEGSSAVVIESIPKPQAFSRLILKSRTSAASETLAAVAKSSVIAEASVPNVRIVTESDPTPPRGTPAVSGSAAAVQYGRLEELAALERSGQLSAEEVERRRLEILRIQ
jgi:uncharacterized membrane protein YdbT with pleckstrin-like domain